MIRTELCFNFITRYIPQILFISLRPTNEYNTCFSIHFRFSLNFSHSFKSYCVPLKIELKKSFAAVRFRNSSATLNVFCLQKLISKIFNYFKHKVRRNKMLKAVILVGGDRKGWKIQSLSRIPKKLIFFFYSWQSII